MKASSSALLIAAVITGLILVEKNKSGRRSEKEKIQQLIDNLEKLNLEKEELVKQRDELMDLKNSINEMGDMDVLLLQRLMDVHSKLENMISNIMKTANETQHAIINSLKGS